MTEPVQPSRHPLLIFGQPEAARREVLPKARGYPAFGRRPSAEEQGQRLGGKWAILEDALARREPAISSDLNGVDPELVLVLEIIGDVPNFSRAVSRIEGFEYLAEIDETGLDGGEAFGDSSEEGQTFDGTLFLLASNQQALSAVLSLWEQYRANEAAPFPRNLGRWKDVFRLLADVRRWSAVDRLRGTGALEDFRLRVAAGQEVIPAELELWYRGDAEKRAAGEMAVRRLVQAAGGEVLTSAVISDIAYHALLVDLPIEAVEPLTRDEGADIQLIRAQEIAFVRPEAQAVVPIAELDGPLETVMSSELPEASSDLPPLVGMLDGLPLAQHVLLRQKLVVDDPDDWASEIPATDRQHGTAIASLILHGDGGQQRKILERPIYARPILKPDDGFGTRNERIPHTRLAVDAVHEAVVRMLDSRSGDAVASTVKLINLSVGDANVQLATAMSPWGRLLDWLSYKYRVVFVVSAGNHPRPYTFNRRFSELASLDPAQIRAETLQKMIGDAQNRRILSPAEAVNTICVGACHDDCCTSFVVGRRIDLLPRSGSEGYPLPSPVSALGMGYRRSIKPDLLAPGGRMLYVERLGGNSEKTTVLPAPFARLGPGLAVASPGAGGGQLDAKGYFVGTSGAAALVSHYGAAILEQIARVRDDSGEAIDERFWAVLAKTLLIHGTSLPSSAREVRQLFSGFSGERLRDAVSRFYGYGVFSPDRIYDCSDTRVTAIGWGELKPDSGARFSFPLPPSLAGVVVRRRLVLTAAYLAPTRVRNRGHRAADIYIMPNVSVLEVARSDSSFRTVRRGTVQHEVFDGEKAAAFIDGDSVEVQVNCRSLVGAMSEALPFGLAVTLEVPAASGMQIYSEISARMRATARTRTRVR
ncbi:S8 family peptidase [Micromonospora chalcea]